MPFITEEIWQHLPGRGLTIMRAPWPESRPELVDEEAEKEMEVLMDITRAIRHIRSEMNVPPGRRAEVLLVVPERKLRVLLKESGSYISVLAGADLRVFTALEKAPEQAAHAVTRGVKIFVPLKGLIDVDRKSPG